MQLEIHPTQAEILMFLLFKPSAHFTELNITGLETDHLNFHVQRLVKLGLIQKNKRDLYELSVKGKEFANRFDTNSAQVERQAKVGVVVIAIYLEKNQKRYLFQKRLKHPFYGYVGFVTGKIRWGETVTETASRELFEETGLCAEFKVSGVEHKMDYDADEKLLEDKYFFVVKAENIQGKLVENYEGGQNIWLTREQAAEIEFLFPDVFQLLDLIEKGEVRFIENKFTVEKY